MGVGADVFVARRLNLSVEGAYTRVSGAEAHFETRLGIGWTWGGKGAAGRPPREALR